MSDPARIVLLNGVGSVGKGSVAKALQLIARGQVDTLHVGLEYDLELDTSKLSAMQCAERIRDAFGL